MKNLTLILLVSLCVSCAPNLSSRTPLPLTIPFEDWDRFQVIRSFGDILRTQWNDPLLQDPALTAVTKEFGPSVISTAPFRSPVAVAKSQPWSSWWFPIKDDVLFNDSNGRHSSALTKYDLVRRKKHEEARRGPAPESAADFERQRYRPNAAPWEGLCDAWALASISVPEPKRPVRLRLRGSDVAFSVSELKALVLKTFEGLEEEGLRYYGQRFTGDFNGWVHPDIFPEQFHRLMEVTLFQNGEPFVFDHDPGVEVWNVPAYKANYLIEPVADQPNSVFVRTWVYAADPSPAQNLDFVGTKEMVRQYNYVLQGSRNGDGQLVVQSGYWVHGVDGIDSRRDHPDFMIRVPNPKALTRKSSNPHIDVSLVDEILAGSY